jgi:CrcB protein
MILYYVIGAALGGVLRFWFERFSLKFISTQFPYGTLAANLLGSYLLGVVANQVETFANPNVFTVVVSFTAAFTTFSGFIGQTVTMFKDQKVIAVGYLLITVFGSLAGFWLGFGPYQ